MSEDRPWEESERQRAKKRGGDPALTAALILGALVMLPILFIAVSCVAISTR